MRTLIFLLFILAAGSVYSQRYFAEVKNDIVQRVIVVESDSLAEKLLGGEWIETYKDSSGLNFASKGFVFHPEVKNFAPPKPSNHPSWILDENLHWQPPEKLPVDGKPYMWNEDEKKWVEIKKTK